jgi:hypothetical protein
MLTFGRHGNNIENTHLCDGIRIFRIPKISSIHIDLLAYCFGHVSVQDTRLVVDHVWR